MGPTVETSHFTTDLEMGVWVGRNCRSRSERGPRMREWTMWSKMGYTLGREEKEAKQMLIDKEKPKIIEKRSSL